MGYGAVAGTVGGVEDAQVGGDGDAGERLAAGAGQFSEESEVEGFAAREGGGAEDVSDDCGNSGIVVGEFGDAGRGADFAGEHVWQEPEHDGFSPVFLIVGGGVGVAIEAGPHSRAVGAFEAGVEGRFEEGPAAGEGGLD